MSKINGLEVKSLKSFTGHEEELLYRGTLYLQGKKIGEFREDFMSGPMDITLLPELDYQKLNNKIVELNKGLPDPWHTEEEDEKDLCPWGEKLKDFCLELMIHRIIDLKNWEKEYKKAHKQYGQVTFVVGTDHYHEYYACFSGSNKEKCIEMCKQEDWNFYINTNPIFHAFCSDKDFEYFEPIMLSDIYRTEEEIKQLKEVRGYVPKITLSNSPKKKSSIHKSIRDK